MTQVIHLAFVENRLSLAIFLGTNKSVSILHDELFLCLGGDEMLSVTSWESIRKIVRLNNDYIESLAKILIKDMK